MALPEETNEARGETSLAAGRVLERGGRVKNLFGADGSAVLSIATDLNPARPGKCIESVPSRLSSCWMGIEQHRLADRVWSEKRLIVGRVSPLLVFLHGWADAGPGEPPDDPPDAILYELGTVPTDGDLRLFGSILSAADTFTQADIDAGELPVEGATVTVE